MSQNLARPAREPILNIPAVVALSIGGLIAIHALRQFLPEDTDFRLIIDWAVIPARWSVAYGGVEPQEVLDALRRATPEGEASALFALAQFVLQDGEGRPWTGLTYALLHGSWAHVLINSVWLAAFGTPIARRCGAGRFFLLSAASAIGGAIFYTYMNPLQTLPMIGASAAVSGMMAAASWFMFAPADWLAEGRLPHPHERPRESLFDIVRNRQVLIFLAVWFAANYLFGFVQPFGVTDASIAWEAHIGGFVVGLVLFPLIDPLPARQTRISA
ncbi:rhomboid family intramembrane serine protease [Microvirga sp. 2TAF3]|uniref:rhomboid family intramembrane serine protease n=1 Tax=Microvirga sp. 2TAF3 TaxID=3233014 RepID=UPI003F9BFC82